MRLPKPHPYSDRRSFERLMLLLAAIAQNPGIGSTRQAKDAGVDPMLVLLEAMQAIAVEQGRESPAWAPATLRKDIKHLKQYGILAKTRIAAGYWLSPEPPPKMPPRLPKRSKSKLRVTEMRTLWDEGKGLTLQQIGDRAGITRARVSQMLQAMSID